MKLTAGILPSSLVKDGPDNTITQNPDLHGGVLIDINPISYRKFYKWIISSDDCNIRKPAECSCGVQCCHKFTPQECDKIIEYLLSWEKECEGDGRVCYISKDSKHGFYASYYNSLLKLFSNTADLPVYYWAN